MPKLLLHRQKGCAQNMAQSLSEQKLEIYLWSLEQNFSESPRDLCCLLKHDNREIETGTNLQIGNIPRENSPSHKSIPKSYSGKLTDACTTIAQSPQQSTSNFCYPKVRLLTQSHLPHCCLLCF